jgi:hypothetical protein
MNIFLIITSIALLFLLYMQFGPLEGVVFADYGSDLSSGPKVPGKPANFV